MRTLWLIFFSIGVGLEVAALFMQRHWILSAICLLFSLAVYYQRRSRVLLTAMIWAYWALFGAAAVACLVLWLDGTLFLQPVALLFGGLYAIAYFYLTIRLKNDFLKG
jgi:hypothetical protein